MTPTEVIDAYVSEVTGNLPRWKRDDVGLELSELLTESLYARAEEAGRPADEAMALAMVRQFGRPAQVAARYHTPITIIEPTDTRSFVLACVIGSICLAVIGLPKAVIDPRNNDIAIMWWTGLMVVVFAIKGFTDRAGAEKRPWSPGRARFRASSDRANRIGSAFTLLVTLAALVSYCWPGPVIGALTGGAIDTSGLTYSHSFIHGWRMQWLAMVLAAYAILYGIVLVDGRWRATTRFFDIALMFHIAWQLGWHFSYGDIFVSPAVETALKPFANGFSLAFFVTMGVKIYAAWGRWPPRKRPSPAPKSSARTGPA